MINNHNNSTGQDHLATNNIIQCSTLGEFINMRKTQSGSKLETHQQINKDYRINFQVKDEEYILFMKLYRSEIKNKKNSTIMEKSKEIGPLYFDFDIKSEFPKRLFTDDDVCNIVKLINKILNKYYSIDIDKDDSEIEEEDNIILLKSYILIKDNPFFNNDKKLYCDGFHIHYPNIILNYTDRLFISELVNSKLENNELMKSLIEETKYPLKEIFDRGVMSKDKWWFLYQSGKVINDDYSIYKVKFIKDNDAVNLENEKDSFIINELSIRRINNSPQILIKKKFDNLLDDFNKKINSKKENNKFFIDNNGNNAENNTGNNTGNNINIVKNINPEQLKDYDVVKKLIKMFNIKRSKNYEEWRNVGWALYNTSPHLKEEFHEFSKLSEDKYNYMEVEKFWNGFNGDPTGQFMSAIHKWAKEDNPEEYGLYLTDKINKLLDSADITAEYDISVIIYEMYKYEYVCSSIKNEIWWQFKNHRWVMVEKANTLSIKLSTEFALEFAKLQLLYNQKGIIEQNNQIADLYFTKSKNIQNLIKKLKQRKNKESLIKECSNLFYDNTFNDKLNENKYLLGFTNGVYDLKKETRGFRSGNPNDFVSFSTGYEYKEFDIEHDDIKYIENFGKTVMPDPIDKKYLDLYDASILQGGNAEQIILFWTGSGANGKGTRTKLLTRALGDYACTVDVSLLTQKRGNSSSAKPELADKKGKRWLQMQEPDGDDKLQLGFLKILTGEDEIQARALYHDPFYFIPQFKMTISLNDKPEIERVDGGITRRIKILNFTQKFVDNPTKSNEHKKDNKLEEKLFSMRQAYIWLLINKYYPEYSEKGLENYEPDSVKAASSQYMDDSNLFKTFMTTKYEYSSDRNNIFQINDMWTQYLEWHKNRYPSIKQSKQPKFVEYLKNSDYIVSPNQYKIYNILPKEIDE
jgi:P4 family phage/plasmid primase-like protien